MRHVVLILSLFVINICNHKVVFADALCELDEENSAISMPWNGRCAWIVRERFHREPGYLERVYGGVIIQELYSSLVNDPNVIFVICTGSCENCNFCGRGRTCNSFVASDGLNCKCIH